MNHMMADLNLLNPTVPHFGSSHVMVGNGNLLPIFATDNILLETPHNSISLNHVYYVPKITNFLFISQLLVIIMLLCVLITLVFLLGIGKRGKF